MQILANALPGFRDLRGPVIAGYLWLLFVFVLVTPDLGHPPDGDLARSLYDLGDAVGKVGVGLALSVAAYLVGAVSQQVSGGAARLVRRSDRLSLLVPGSSPLTAAGSLGSIAEAFARGERIVAREAAKAEGRADPSVGPASDGELAGILDLEEQNRRAVEEVSRELSMPATLLVGDRPELFAEVDRLRAEGELRITVSLPLAALTVLLGVVASPWWLLALVAVVLILRQGVERDEESRKVIADAMAMNKVDSPALSAFGRWVDEVLPGRAAAHATVVRHAHRTADAALSNEEREYSRKAMREAEAVLERSAASGAMRRGRS